ncbi:MAG TPA: phosphatidate cytidylyltransferase, partial [Thermoanaerobaculia bacterium]|nr:phosphatidate cytidylyltransferase [Thermoanaerobaculia bacterium]
MRFAREITAAVLSPLTIWIIGWSHPYVFDAVIAVVAVLAMYEFLSLGKAKGYELPVPLCIVIMLIIIAAFVLENLSVELGMFAALLIIPASYVFSKKSLA